VHSASIETRFGCEALSGYVPEQDATIVAKMKAAGAIILGKTAMPDFATSWFGYSSVNGETKNPYDLDRGPGGSSAGTGLRSRLTSPRSESAKTPAAQSGCQQASTTWSACV
jgi:Asp-tRNA(Asn)/Glu-tRNA(Gln) amidotransferase A subunit family amidase